MAFADFTRPFKLHTDASAIGLGAVLYQEQGGKDQVIGYASRALSKRKSRYQAHKLEFLALKWAVAESFQEYLYGNTFTSYSDNNPLNYGLTIAKLDTTRHRWIAKLAEFNFTIYYCLGKCNVEADALSRIPRDQKIKAEAVGAIFKTVIEGPEALMEVYACHKKAVSSLIPESPPTCMTVMEWVQAQKVDPAINQVITWTENGKLDTVKVSDEMSQEVKLYLRQKGQL